MSPVAETWVPPHNSMLKRGTLTTRTVSPARQTGADADHSFDRRRCAARLAENPSGVRHLPAGLEIEGRLRQRDESALAAGQRVDRRPLLVEQADDRYAADPRRRVPLE